jgi:hypothetical protein
VFFVFFVGGFLRSFVNRSTSFNRATSGWSSRFFKNKSMRSTDPSVISPYPSLEALGSSYVGVSVGSFSGVGGASAKSASADAGAAFAFRGDA